MTFCKFIPALCVGAALLLLQSCAKNEPEPCAISSVEIETTSTYPCKKEGRIVVKTPVGPDYSYSVGYGAYQSSPRFEALFPGTHIVVARSNQGCSDTLQVSIPEPPSGPLFAAVKKVLGQYCLPCHGGFSPLGDVDITNSCHVIESWERIDARAVQGISSPMPQSGLMPLADRNKIVAWIKAGHQFSN